MRGRNGRGAAGRIAAAMVLAGLLVACGQGPRGNTFLDPLYGRESGPGAPVFEENEPLPQGRAGTVAGRGLGTDSIAGVPRRQSAVVRSRTAAPPDPARVDRLRRALGVQTAPPVPLETGLPATDTTVTLNFVGADIREFVDTVFGAALGVDYFLDPQVSGRVTLQTQRALGPRALLSVAQEVLRANGADIQLSDGLYVIAPSGARPGEGGQARIVRIVALTHLAAGQSEELLAPFLTEDVTVARLPEGRMLLLSGPRDQVIAIEELLRVFDIDPLAGRDIALIPLATAPSVQVAEELDRILGPAGRDDAAAARVIAVERMNAVLVIAEAPGILAEARFWAGELDRGADAGEGGQLFVYDVQNRRAADLADVFTALYADEGRRSVTVSRGDALAPGIEAAIAASETAAAADGTATEGAAPAAGPARAQGATLEIEGDPVRIYPDIGTNAIVVRAPPDRFRAIEAALRRLDTAPRQVLIEATIAEVALTDALEFGVRWFFETGNFDINFTDSALGFVGSSFPGFNVFLDGNDFRVVLSALDQVSDVEFVSTPSLMVLDNQSARLQVGDQVPVATRSAVNVSDPDAPVVNAIEFRDTGVILEVTPRVNQSGLVSLDIRQEVSEVVETNTSEIDSPTIQQRSFSSSVTIESGQAVMLGGLIRERRQSGRAGVPILSDIPLLGNLFSATDRQSARTELIVVLRPRVIHSPADALAVTREMRAKLRTFDRLELGF